MNRRTRFRIALIAYLSTMVAGAGVLIWYIQTPNLPPSAAENPPTPSAASATVPLATSPITSPLGTTMPAVRVDAPDALPPAIVSLQNSINGTVVDADGKAVSGADVRLVPAGAKLVISKAVVARTEGALSTRTNIEGGFSFSRPREAYEVVVLANEGFARKTWEDFAADSSLKLQPWSRVEGHVLNGTKPVAHAEVDVVYENWSSPILLTGPAILAMDHVQADSQGKFVIERAFAGRVKGGVSTAIKSLASEAILLPRYTPWREVKAGQTLQLQVGGIGRAVHAQLRPGPSLAGAGVQFSAKLIAAEMPEVPTTPLKVMEMMPEQLYKWRKSDESALFDMSWGLSIGAAQLDGQISSNGSLVITDVPSGKYQLVVLTKGSAPALNGKLLLAYSVTVPPMAAGVSDEPLDLGPLTLDLPPSPFAKGDDVSSIQLKLEGGKEATLGDYHGKITLLNYWFVGMSDTLPDREGLGPVWEAYGKSGKVAVIGVYSNMWSGDNEAYLKQRPTAWPEADISAEEYRFSTMQSATWIIGPNGKVLEATLRGNQIERAVEKALGK